MIWVPGPVLSAEDVKTESSMNSIGEDQKASSTGPPPLSRVASPLAFFTCSHGWGCGTGLVISSRDEVCREVSYPMQSQLPVGHSGARKLVTPSD